MNQFESKDPSAYLQEHSRWEASLFSFNNDISLLMEKKTQPQKEVQKCHKTFSEMLSIIKRNPSCRFAPFYLQELLKSAEFFISECLSAEQTSWIQATTDVIVKSNEFVRAHYLGTRYMKGQQNFSEHRKKWEANFQETLRFVNRDAEEVSRCNQAIFLIDELLKKNPISDCGPVTFEVVGSQATGLAVRGLSDLDLTLLLPKNLKCQQQQQRSPFKELFRNSNVEAAGEKAKSSKGEAKRALLNVKEAMKGNERVKNVLLEETDESYKLTFLDLYTQLKVSMTVDQTVEVEKAHFIKECMQSDDRALHLSLIIKHWCKMSQRNQSYKFPSYALTLMAIAFLQHKGIIPPKASTPPPSFLLFPSQSSAQLQHSSSSSSNSGQRGPSLGELVFEFFIFYFSKYKPFNQVICVAEAPSLQEFMMGFHDQFDPFDSFKLVDPFDMRKNPAASLKMGTEEELQFFRNVATAILDLMSEHAKLETNRPQFLTDL